MNFKIIGSIASRSGKAIFEGREIWIDNSKKYIGQYCLAKMDLYPDGGPLRGRFITSEIPENFQTLDAEEHIFLGLWNEYMEKKDQYPTLKEINKYYDPGRMPQAVYIAKDSNKYKGRVAITPTDVWEIKRAYNRILKKLPDPKRASRIILGENQEIIQIFSEKIKEKGLVPIVMEPLNQN